MRRLNLATLTALLFGAMVSSVAWALHSGALPFVAERAEGPGASDAPRWFMEEVVGKLDLSEEQAASIERIRKESGDRIHRLETSLASTRSALRAAEEAAVFDEAMAGNLIRQQAEIAAYLWGTRTRVTSEVYRILTPEQRLAFSAFRSQQEELRPEESERRD